MRHIGVLEAKTHFSALLDAVEKGERITITRHGHPVAELTPSAELVLSKPKLSRQEIAEGFRVLREEIAAAHPETLSLTWDDLKSMART